MRERKGRRIGRIYSNQAVGWKEDPGGLLVLSFGQLRVCPRAGKEGKVRRWSFLLVVDEYVRMSSLSQPLACITIPPHMGGWRVGKYVRCDLVEVVGRRFEGGLRDQTDADRGCAVCFGHHLRVLGI
jgi:hypothetical protein